MQHVPGTRALVVACVVVASALAGCTGSDVTETPAIQEPVSEQPAPAAPLPVSSRVPVVEELLEIGLTEQQAECFIQAIDPDGVGEITNPDLFPTAFDDCIGA